MQVDKIGVLVIWSKDAKSRVITDSHWASYSVRVTGSAKTWIAEKQKGETVATEFETRAGRKSLVISVK